MIQRSIASVVLAALCWLSLPVAFGSQQTSAVRVQRDASPAHDHSCCPGSHPRISPTLFLAINSPAMPCGEQHPCCARRAPSNPSTMPVETNVVRPAAERVLAIVAHRPSLDRGRMVETSAICFLPPPFERSTVLRIWVFASCPDVFHERAANCCGLSGSVPGL